MKLEQFKTDYPAVIDVMEDPDGSITGFSKFSRFLMEDPPDWIKITDTFLSTKGWNQLSDPVDKTGSVAKIILDGLLTPLHLDTDSPTWNDYNLNPYEFLQSGTDIPLINATVMIAEFIFMRKSNTNPYIVSETFYQAEKILDSSKAELDLRLKALQLLNNLSSCF